MIISEANCPNCGIALPPRGRFCPKCATPTRCGSCGSLLEPGAVACVECGVLVGQEGSIGGSTGTDDATAAVNVIRFEETRSTRSLQGNLTDDAVASLSEAIGAVLSGRLEARPKRLSRSKLNDAIEAATSVGETTYEPTYTIEAEGTIVSPPGSPSITSLSSDQERMREVFRYDGQHFLLDQSELKGDSKRDTVSRLTYLLLLAHELEGRPRVPRSVILAVIKDAGLHDSNTSKVFGQLSDLSVDADTVGLRSNGRIKAREYLEAVLDPNVANTWKLSSKPRGRIKAEKAESEEGEVSQVSIRRKSVGSKKMVMPWVKAWHDLNLPVNGHAIISSRSVADKGIFGLWAIRRAAPDAGKAASRGNIALFLWETFEIKVDDRGLDRSLSKGADGRVARVTGATFQILPPGVKWAEELAGVQGGSAPTNFGNGSSKKARTTTK